MALAHAADEVEGGGGGRDGRGVQKKPIGLGS